MFLNKNRGCLKLFMLIEALGSIKTGKIKSEAF
jgi:hypothetical protein